MHFLWCTVFSGGKFKIHSGSSLAQGEDTAEVLAELGFSAAEMDELIAKGAVKCSTRSKL